MSSLEIVTRNRWRLATFLTLAMVFVYFGFICLVAFDKTLMGTLISEGMSVGILLGALVIVAAWILTFIYVRWANANLDKIEKH